MQQVLWPIWSQGGDQFGVDMTSTCNVMTGLGQTQWRRFIILSLLLLAMAFSQPASAQQQYNNVSGYGCAGVATSCQSYAFYRTQGSGSTLATVATIFNTSSMAVANASGIDPERTTPFPDKTLMYVPLACSCTNGTYEAGTSHVVAKDETMYIIANSTYQGLTTYQAIEAANPAVDATTMPVGQLLNIPVRCACPSTAQRRAGASVLLSYSIFPLETLSVISGRFNVSVAELEAANNVTDPSQLRAFSTLLIPLPALVALNSSALAPPAPAPMPPDIAPLPPPSKSSQPVVWIVVGALGGAFVLAAVVLGLCFCCRRSHVDPAEKAFQAKLRATGGNSQAFSETEIKEATTNYEKVIGRGGFGDVFYGKLSGGQEVAAKVLSAPSHQSKAEFYNEERPVLRIP